MKKVRCSAGTNYCMAYPNGDVYRCMRDYNTRSNPLLNIKDNFSLFDRPQICIQRICNTSCDSDWATKWFIEDDRVKNKIQATEWDGVTSIHPWKFQNLEDEDINKFIMIIWTPTLLCNYNCSYCGCAASKNKIFSSFPSSSPEVSTSEWIAFFEKVIQTYSWGLLQTNGGEPILSQATIPVLRLISSKFAINLVSNISVKINELVRSGIPPFSKKTNVGLMLTASLHPSTKNFSWDAFLGKLMLLKEYGYLRGVNFVAWPEQMFAYPYYKKILDNLNIQLWLQPWVGPDNSGYNGYTQIEQEFVDRYASNSRVTNNQLDLKDYVPIPPWNSEIILVIAQKEDDNVKFTFKVKNTGTEVWTEDNAVRLGVKLLNNIEGLEKPEKEFRAYLDSDVANGDIFIKEIVICNKDFPVGKSRMIVDIVKENAFWLSQQGSEILQLTINRMTNGEVDITEA